MCRLTYCIPHNSTNLWLHALGGQEGLVSGQFTVMLNPDNEEVDYMVDLLLTYDYDDADAKNSSAVCLMRENDKWGVGIYVSGTSLARSEPLVYAPKTPPDFSNHTLNYQLSLLVPHAKGPLNLPQFTTYLPWFSHSFQDLNNSLVFDDVEISGIASSIDGVRDTTIICNCALQLCFFRQSLEEQSMSPPLKQLSQAVIMLPKL